MAPCVQGPARDVESCPQGLRGKARLEEEGGDGQNTHPSSGSRSPLRGDWVVQDSLECAELPRCPRGRGREQRGGAAQGPAGLL